MDQGSNKNHSPAYNFAPTVTKFCVMWEGQALPHDTKFGNCRCNIVDSRAFPSWSLIHGLRWSGLIKAEPGDSWDQLKYIIQDRFTATGDVCPSASEVTLKGMGKIGRCLTTTKHKQARIVHIIRGMYCVSFVHVVPVECLVSCFVNLWCNSM